MLQQTRVEAVIPYYERFLSSFPDVLALAAAAETEVLARWSGLGYYSRARNLHRAAKRVAESGVPRSYEEIAALPGVGPYTSAAIASIAGGLPHAAVDGNVLRVISRLANDAGEITAPVTRRRFTETAGELLDPVRPGDFNQAMMELGATLCVPRTPRCPVCPVEAWCHARAAGTQAQLPVKRRKPRATALRLDLLLLRSPEPESLIFLVQRDTSEARLAGFWELPGKNLFPGVRARRSKSFVHQIVNDRFRVTVWTAGVASVPVDGRWFSPEGIAEIPLTTISRKAIG